MPALKPKVASRSFQNRASSWQMFNNLAQGFLTISISFRWPLKRLFFKLKSNHTQEVTICRGVACLPVPE